MAPPSDGKKVKQQNFFFELVEYPSRIQVITKLKWCPSPTDIMEQVMKTYNVPDDVVHKICYRLHNLRMRLILHDERLSWIMTSLHMEYDRGYTVRNYYETWNTVPRYYDTTTNRMYGYYRQRGRCTTSPV